MEPKKYLGCEGKDKITGFAGIIIGYCEYITGCKFFLIQPYSDGKIQTKQEFVDCHRVEIMSKVINKEDVINHKLL